MTTLTCEQIYALADAAGRAAGNKSQPTPMIVGSAKSFFGGGLDTSKPTYVVEGGVCGFAWIKIKGNTKFGRWAKKNRLARDSYPAGLQISVSQYGQSMTRKEDYAYAFAQVLNENGITAYSDSRMD